ncbi:hypothetical protein HELRODRAFT_157030 [Helobdella robusta]|uniref:Lanosterol 14-alpha demethylase n=1 Tax=Helobdella robusta TaxID=6412 RepID=T1EM49_HELRO|nr:hypothetical protein HELRODRAFT_157030 [Helobdella robusta]ESO04014.1 hypothetical protein HELRODRAFT_157030 [Helobdella robusta]
MPSTIPFVGHSIQFSKSPVEFLTAAYFKHGPVFSFTMVGKTFTYLLGSQASALFFSSKNEDLNAEEVYAKLTTPVFGKGVAYDVPNNVFLEQKKLLKTGFSISRFKHHVHLIERELLEYFNRWQHEGEADLFASLSELIILTASSCLHGKEIRSLLSEDVAQLYWDLDAGFSHLAWVLPAWFPLPSFKRRDRAHRKMKELFLEAIRMRRSSQTKEDDMLQTLIDASYKNGRALSDDEISGMLIGLLLAGQHTSSTTASWLGFFIAKHQDIQDALYEEQRKVFGKHADGEHANGEQSHGHLSYDGLKECHLLDLCLKETLRMRPPIVTMMRMCKTPQKILNYVIPAGHQICVSPTTNHRLPDTWHQPQFFDPYRSFMDKFVYVPFGAGRHRCIGEAFAYVQIKSIWSYLIQKFHFELVGGKFPEVNVTTMIHTPSDPIIRYRRR